MDEKKDKVLFVLKRTRKAYLIEYGCVLLLLGSLAFIMLEGVVIHKILSGFGLGLATFALISTEYSRMITRYKFTPAKIVVVHGVVKQSKKNVYFHPLAFNPDINVRQSRIGRLLNYGTVFIQGAGEHMLEIKDVDRPKRILETIEELIDHTRRRME